MPAERIAMRHVRDVLRLSVMDRPAYAKAARRRRTELAIAGRADRHGAD